MKIIMHTFYKLLLLIPLLFALAACSSLPPASLPPAHYTAAYKAEGRLLRTPDNLTLFGQWWVPPEQTSAKGVVLLVHGTAMHSGFYAPWAEALAFHGYAVFGIDLRGWGQSQGFGRRGYVRNYDEYVRDVGLAYREVRRRYPEAPVFLEGESLGGTVALLTATTAQLPFAGLVLNAPAVKPNPGLGFLRLPGGLTSFGLWAAGTAGKVWPNFPVIPLDVPVATEQAMKAVFFDDYARQRFLEDPLNTHTALPAAYITGIEEASSRLQDNLVNVQLPFIVLQGDKDNLVPPASSELLMEKAGATDKTLKLYKGMSHTTLHDKGHEQVWADTLAWLDAHVAALQAVESKEASVPVTAAAH